MNLHRRFGFFEATAGGAVPARVEPLKGARQLASADRDVVDEDLTFLRISQARDEIHQRALAAPGGSDDADRGSRGRGE